VVRHSDAAVVKPFSAAYQVHRDCTVCEDCVFDRSLASLLSGYRFWAAYNAKNCRIRLGVQPVQRFRARRKFAGSLKFRYSATASLLSPLI